jgi:AraC family transcriptional regulator
MKQALGCGEFFGSPSRHHGGAGIVLSHLIATGEVEPHVHDDPHLVWITGGHYVSSAAGEADDGPILIYNPAGTSHRDHFHDSRGSFFTISMRSPFLGRWCELPPAARHVSHPRVRGRAFELMQEFWGGPDSPLLVEGLCTELIPALIEPQDERKPPHWLARAREVLHERAAENLSLADVAGEMGVHPIHFTRAFRRFFGCTPGVYLRACRLQRAADLLRRSDIGLSEIAFAAGFSDQSHFTHRFTKHFGLAPGAYRRLTT